MAFLLDTVTVSELRKGERIDGSVRSWQATCSDKLSYLSVITLSEIRYGIRKQEGCDPDFAKLLQIWYDNLISQPQVFALLEVSLPIAELAADFRAINGLSYNDSLIAATARTTGLTLATRNVSDFEKTGIDLVNPWESGK